VSASEQERPDVKERRRNWWQQVEEIDPRRFIFIDESGAKTNMARLRARAPVGERAASKEPAGHWATTTMIGAVRLSGPCATLAVEGATDAEVFRVYVEQFARYGENYLSFSGLVVLLTWIYVTSLLLLLGGRLNIIIRQEWHGENTLASSGKPTALTAS
jgi:hypothetical protein